MVRKRPESQPAAARAVVLPGVLLPHEEPVLRRRQVRGRRLPELQAERNRKVCGFHACFAVTRHSPAIRHLAHCRRVLPVAPIHIDTPSIGPRSRTNIRQSADSVGTKPIGDVRKGTGDSLGTSVEQSCHRDQFEPRPVSAWAPIAHTAEFLPPASSSSELRDFR
jgi:hypothetical protein